MTDVSGAIKIRAHHLLCMQCFQGYGYSEDFVTNMAQVIKNLKSPNREIEIITECDVICSPCPNNKGGVCKKDVDSAEKVNNMDTQILKKLGLISGAKVKSQDIVPLLKTNLNSSDIEGICGDCEWKQRCIEVLSPRWNNASSFRTRMNPTVSSPMKKMSRSLGRGFLRGSK